MKLTTKQLKQIIKEEIDDMMGSSPEDPMVKFADLVAMEGREPAINHEGAETFMLPMANELIDSLALDPDLQVSDEGLQRFRKVTNDLYAEIEAARGEGFNSHMEAEHRIYHLRALQSKVAKLSF
jgi:hypothetical protein